MNLFHHSYVQLSIRMKITMKGKDQMYKVALPKTLTLFIALAALSVWAGNASAEPGDKRTGDKGWEEGRGHEGDGEGRRKWMEKLNLTADQRKRIDAVRSERKEKMKTVVEQLHAEHRKLRDMLKGDATDAQLREQHGKYAALQAQMGETFFDSMLRIRAVLTPDQRKELKVHRHEGKGGECERRRDQKD
ncbi:MAG: Spy/CpxP family protein refolding chaperone [Nitrospinae bacterium]|nr:Spy/CpxP family protein refolding chaperone [Nitrospinota bacterium]